VKLDTEFIKLPLLFDARRLAEEAATISESQWKAHPQGFAGNSAISLVAVGGDPQTDAVAGRNTPTPILEQLPYIRQVLAALEAPIGRTRLMRIASKSEANAHVDSSYYWLQRVRVHVPLVTWPSVQFLCGERQLHMAAGECWLFDTWRLHNVLNPAEVQRIHLVVDTVGSSRFWHLVDGGERPFLRGAPTPAPPRFVKFDPQLQVTIPTESFNFPVVMSPWEQEHLIRFLLDDLKEAPNLNQSAFRRLSGLLNAYQREWHGLWARFGDLPQGWDDYRRVRERLQADLKPLEGTLRLPNGTEAVASVLRAVVGPALNPEMAPPTSPQRPTLPGQSPQTHASSHGSSGTDERHARTAVNISPEETTAAMPGPSPPRTTRLDRPVIIVAAPRSGSSFLFETLARSPDLWTIGGESHGVFERRANLQPADHGYESNRLTAADADAVTVAAVYADFLERLRRRDGQSLPTGAPSVRLLEKTPKNALRIEFLTALFPDAVFIYLFREPEENLASIIEAWRSGRFVTYPGLPGWEGPPWSLLLIPGWRQLGGQRLEEIAAAQYAAAHEQILRSLEQIPADRWTAVSYEKLVSDPQQTVLRLCRFAGVAWDQELRSGELPLSRHTLTPPQPEKWRVHEGAIGRVMPQVTAIAERARQAVRNKSRLPAPVASPAPTPLPAAMARPPALHEVRPARAPTNGASPAPAGAGGGIRCVNTNSFPALLEQLGISLAVTTYQAGKLILLRVSDGKLNAHFRSFSMPMGLAASRRRLAVGSRLQVSEFHNQPEVGRKLPPPGKHDACYLPLRAHTTGDIRVHEIAFGDDELWIVNTRFSCLCTLDHNHSFVPRWRPPFVTALAPEDRCHLNGLAMAGGKPKYVTCHAATDQEAGWRPSKADSGCLVDVDSGDVVVAGLSMPHSPRCYANHVFLLESGVGSLARVEPFARRLETLVRLPGFTRGLDFFGHYAFVGLSQVRESAVFSGIPITESYEPRHCGVWIIDLNKLEVAGFLRFEAGVQEIFAVQVLRGIRYPDVILDDESVLASSFKVPQEALREVPAEILK
jgi:uncharacterized protein (TIGR03032 family)